MSIPSLNIVKDLLFLDPNGYKKLTRGKDEG